MLINIEAGYQLLFTEIYIKIYLVDILEIIMEINTFLGNNLGWMVGICVPIDM